MTPATNADLLTRTTLQVDGGLAAGSLAQMISALRRVPGVLLAEANGANTGAVVAHDAAVSAISLIAAAENVGVHVRVVADKREAKPGNLAAPPHSLGNRQLLVVAAFAFVVVATVDLVLPNAAQKHGILIVLTSSLWAFFVAKSFLRQRRS